jgi:Flp pilus assembly pilin Flp
MSFAAVTSAVRKAAMRLMTLDGRLTEPQAAQSMVEYAIVAALIAVVAMTAVQSMGTGIQTVFENIVQKIQGLGR